MSITRPISRRTFVKSAAITGAAAQFGATIALAEEEMVCGGIYVGAKDDYGYNQGHAEAVAKVGELPG
ncbi:MAG: twin-arginine translocation signal domain-containing protein, partial [Burkholderiales bacterium]